jgi:hypothetical protein
MSVCPSENQFFFHSRNARKKKLENLFKHGDTAGTAKTLFCLCLSAVFAVSLCLIEFILSCFSWIRLCLSAIALTSAFQPRQAAQNRLLSLLIHTV